MKNTIKVLLFSLMTVFVSSCDDDTVDLPDNYVAFKTAEVGLTGADATLEITLTRAADAAIPVTVTLTPSGVEYGKHFTTEPAATGNVISLTIPQGQSSASIKVTPVAGILLSGSETLNFSISQVTAPTLIGLTKDAKLSFSKIISQGSQLTLEGKTSESNYANNVYVDLSGNSTHLNSRKSWNLAFTNDSRFRVVLNHTYQTTAAATTKTDIAQVTLADTATTADIYLSTARLTDPVTISLVDSWDGDLNKTVFAEVSATSSENKVYLVAFEGSNTPKSKWYKVKVDRSGSGYKVQYAPIGETSVKTVEIAKNADFNLSFLSFETGVVTNVEPKAKEWDIQYAYSTYNSGLNTPYWFQDFILLNYLGGAEAAEVAVSTVSYDNYAESNIASTSFVKTRDAIGSKWRVTSGTAIGVTKDKFYVIKDAEGNVYKLKFVNAGIGTDGGERGKPVIEYKLVKKA